jgi:DNA (cytosine-5)-methyltransferase 1
LALDNNKYCTETLELNIDKFANENIDILCKDIREFEPNKYLREKRIKKSEISAIVGGPPCQAFSSAGKRLGLDDERGNVSIKFLNIVDDIKPKYVVIENVRGLLSTVISKIPSTRYKINVDKHLLSTKQGLMLLFLDQLSQMGYSTSFTLYDMSRFGIPQKRERVILTAYKGKTKIPLIKPTHGEEYSFPLKNLRDAIGHLNQKEMTYANFPDKRIKYYKMLSEGENWRSLPEDLQKEALGKSYYLGGGKTGFYRRLSWDKPSPTLITHPSSFPATDLCHPEVIRPLSIEEYAAIQTFPDNWKFAGSISNIYKQIGNAVPVEFGKLVGKHILSFDSNKRKFSGTNINYPEQTHSRYYKTSHNHFESLLNNNQPTII